MSDPSANWPRMDKTAFSVCSLDDMDDEYEYWQSRTPHDRLAALELMRQVVYGYDPATARLQRVIEVAQLDESECLVIGVLSGYH